MPTPTATAAPVQIPLMRVALSDMRSFGVTGSPGSLRQWSEPLYDDVVGMKSDGTLSDESGLGSSWETSSDGLIWTVKIRDGVVFHDGGDLTAEDVRFTYETLLREDFGSGNVSPYNRNVASMEAPDANTLVVNMAQKNIFFAHQILSPGSTEAGHVMSKAAIEAVPLDEFLKNPVGSGPFRFESLSVNEKIVYDAVDNHWYYGVPKVKRLEFHLVKDETARVALIKSGDIEVIEGTRASAKELTDAGFDLAVDPDSNVAVVMVHGQYQTEYNGVPNPLANAKARLALSYAIDRQAIADALMEGQAVPSLDYPVGSRSPGYVRLEPPTQDLDRARALLAEAGYPDGFEMDMTTATWGGLPEGPEIAEALAVMWEKIGITVNRKPVELSAWIGTWGAQGQQAPTVHAVYWASNRTVASMGLHDPEGAYRLGEDPEIHAAVQATTAAGNLEEHAAKAAIAHKLYQDRASVIPVVAAGTIFVVASGLGGDTWDLGKSSKGINIKMLAGGRAP